MQATRGAAVADQHQGHKRRGALAAFAITAVLVLLADAVSKAVVVARLTPDRPVDVIGSVLRLDLTRNPGAAFSIGTGATVIFTAAAVIVAIVIIRTARRLISIRWAICLGLLLGGALGNLADRIFRAPGPFRGHVVDWIQLPHWPVFNLADSAIVLGAIAAVLLAMSGVPLTAPMDRQPPDSEGEPE